MRLNTIRFKTTVLYSSILGFILICFSVFLFHSVKQILLKNLDDELRLEAEQMTATINAYGEVSSGQLPATSLMRQLLTDNDELISPEKAAINKLWDKHRWLLGEDKDLFIITDINGRVLLQSDNVPSGAWGKMLRLSLTQSGYTEFANVRLADKVYREICRPFTFASRRPYILYLAAPMEPVHHLLSKIVAMMVLGIVAVMLLSLFIGSFLTGKILQPVTEVTRIANKISQKNLSVRIEAKSLDEEMKLLVDSFNQMISRLESSFDHINEFSSHAAHELKTPLAIIKGELELALSSQNSREEDRKAMFLVLMEVERMIKITKDLLLLAKYEYNLDIFKMEKMNLAEFLQDVYHHANILAGERDIQLTLKLPQAPVWIEADATHLRRLFFNIIHNAIKFTPKGGRIMLVIRVDARVVLVEVKDTGEGITPEDLRRIFEKFYSSSRKDRPEQAGNGLGLSMARSIAKAHGGDIAVVSERGKGSTFTVTLPLNK